jgi:hypothetical protein
MNLRIGCFVILSLIVSTATPALDVGPEQIVEAGGTPIAVPGYSVPSFVPWDGDTLPDLVTGEGGGGYPDGKIRIYRNTGSPGSPAFTDYVYAQSGGGDLVVPASGCLGACPRVVYWDADDRKDLVVGLADGRILLYLNVGTDDAPVFKAGTYLQVGPEGSKTDIDVQYRATPTIVDWNSDGRRDLVSGSMDGRIYVFINEGTDTEPDFISFQCAQSEGADIEVPTIRSAPAVADLDGDGMKDLVSGNTEGELWFYTNVSSQEQPAFCCGSQVTCEGAPIDIIGSPRSRPSLCDWTGDGVDDLLVGAGDGLIRLFPGLASSAVEEPPLATSPAVRLGPAFPNPAAGRTAMRLTLARAGEVRIGVHDPAGRTIAILAERYLEAGAHDIVWNGLDRRGLPVAPGIYFVSARGPGTSATKVVLTSGGRLR